jgi:hypothetical protein
VIVTHFHTLSVPTTTPEQTRHFQSKFYGERSGAGILNVKEVQSLPEHLGFVILLNAEALLSVEAPETLLKETQVSICHPRCCHLTRPVQPMAHRCCANARAARRSKSPAYQSGPAL